MTGRPLVVALLLAAVWAGCGRESGASATLASAEESLAELPSGRMELRLTASTPDTSPVGFAVEGPFDFDRGTDLPVMDLTSTRLLGDREVETRVVADGTSAWLVADGATKALTADAVGGLRLGDDNNADAVPDLELAEWVVDPSEKKSGGTTTVTGTVDVAAFLADLQRLAAETGASGTVAPLDDEAADRLQKLARSSAIEVVTDDQGAFRSLTTAVDFGTEIPDELQEALGPYAAARLELDMAVEPLDGPLRVGRPE